MSLLTYLDPNAIKDASIEGIKIKDNSISSSKIDETVASKSYVDALEARATNAVKVTYTELKSLRDSGKLIPGTQYRITDYQCTTSQSGTKSAGHVFDIIVTADDESTLNEEARAVKHDGDTYFDGCNLNAWKLWYCLDNDANRFAWAIEGELMGTIKPTSGSCSGTYTYSSPISKIMLNDRIYVLEIGVRTQIYQGPPIYITKTDGYTLVLEDEYNVTKNIGISVYTYSQKDKGVIYRMIDEFNNDVPYDFKNIQFKYPKNDTAYPYYYYTFASDNVEDNTDYSLSIVNYCYSNVIKEYVTSDKRTLNQIIFIGPNCYSNTFGSNCHNNSFGNYCYYNTFGNYCFSNTFGNNCGSNTFGNNCNSNTFGNDCFGNTFGNYCYYNTFGNYCFGNTFGNYCPYIKFASNSSASTKYNYYQHNHFGDGCKYIVFTGAETASDSAQVQNYNFAQGLKGTEASYLTINGKRNLAYETKVAKNSNGELKIYCEADLIL